MHLRSIGLKVDVVLGAAISDPTGLKLMTQKGKVGRSHKGVVRRPKETLIPLPREQETNGGRSREEKALLVFIQRGCFLFALTSSVV